MIQTREDVAAVCSDCEIPSHMWHAVEQYLFDRVPCGGFFMAVVSNDLMGAFFHADELNGASMYNWANLLYNEFPAPAWGSPEKVQKWLEQGKEESQ